MDKTFSHLQNVRTGSSYDVIVAGGGVAGVAAALAAARNGCSVLLLEKGCSLGGLATNGLVNLFVPMCNGRGIAIMRGMAEEFLRISVKYGFATLNKAWSSGHPSEATNLRYATFFDPNILALLFLEILENAGVKVLFDAVLANVIMDNGACTGAIVLCEEGARFFPAKMMVDATGTSQVFDRAGAPTELGDNYFSYHGFAATVESCKKVLEKNNIRYLFSWKNGGNASLYGERHPENMPFFHGDTSENVTRYLRENQLCLLEKLKAEDPLARTLTTLPAMPQFRKVRRIIGEYTLTEADLYKHCEDSVTALCDSERRDSLYEIPFRALYNRNYPNLIAAGRNISAAGYLWDVSRVIPPAIVTGQAAGSAAAMAVKKGCSLPKVPVQDLQENLAAQNVLIHFEESWIPENRLAGEYSPASHSHPDRSGE